MQNVEFTNKKVNLCITDEFFLRIPIPYRNTVFKYEIVPNNNLYNI